MVENFTDEQIWNLKRGGHDYRKLYARLPGGNETTPVSRLSFSPRRSRAGRWARHFEGRNATHQMKKLTLDDLKGFRERLYLDIPDSALEADPYPAAAYYHHPARTPTRWRTWHERRQALAGTCRSAGTRPRKLDLPKTEAYKDAKRGSGKQKIATTMAFVRLLKDLLRAKTFGARWVPIIPDEARTFGMDSTFPDGADLLAARAELQRWTRISSCPTASRRAARSCTRASNEVGSVASFHGGRLVLRHPRRTDNPALHLLFDVRVPAHGRRAVGRVRPDGARLPARATAGRTTLNGEGLQHEDGHSHLIARHEPGRRRLRPGVRVRDGAHRRGRSASHVRRRPGETSSTT